MEITYTNATPNDIEAIFNLNKELIDKYAKVKKVITLNI